MSLFCWAEISGGGKLLNLVDMFSSSFQNTELLLKHFMTTFDYKLHHNSTRLPFYTNGLIETKMCNMGIFPIIK